MSEIGEGDPNKILNIDDYRIKKDLEPQKPEKNGILARLKRILPKADPNRPYVPHRGELRSVLSEGEVQGIGEALKGNINIEPITTMDVSGQPNPPKQG